MKSKLLFFILLLNIHPAFALVDTQLSFVSNELNSSSGMRELVFNVEAYSTGGNEAISIFENAILLDSVLREQIPGDINVLFSDQYFPEFRYSIFEDYDEDSGIIVFKYEFQPFLLPRFSIDSDTVNIVTITIQYLPIDRISTIYWYSGLPNYLVTNEGDNQVTGAELPIPPGLIDFPLPVELNSFTANAKGSSAELKWQTETEVNNYGFEIERACQVDEGEITGFEKIGFVPGNGNSNSEKNYSFIDKNLSGGSRFIYRLKQIDSDGTFSYSYEVEIELLPDKFSLYQNYPNPFNPSTKIKFNLPGASRVRLDIYNITGEHLTTLLDKNMEAGFYEVNFNASDYSSGTYIYNVTTDNSTSAKKMMLIK